MKKLEKAYVPKEEIILIINDLRRRWNEGDTEIRNHYNSIGEIEKTLWDEHEKSNVFKNDIYQVDKREYGDGSDVKLIHLSIKRIDRQPIHDWRDLQEIKNQLVGEECEAVELYPAESRRVDSANQYHLWCVNDPYFRFPFGFKERYVTDIPLGKSQNRAL
jgi:hypothetical protein